MLNNKIALMSDFGNDSHYVGIMKGVISNLSPESQIIDICHSIIPQNIKQAAFILRESFSFFPVGTVFCCVVDPGVGSIRKPLVVRTNRYAFVVPDNGILSYCIDEFDEYSIFIPDEKYFLKNMSFTFHGRDVFAPLSAYVARGERIEGEIIWNKDIVLLEDIKENISNDSIDGELVYTDHFGNIISSIQKSTILKLLQNDNIYDCKIVVFINQIRINGISRTYSEVDIGEFIAYIGSSDYLEVGIRNGNAISKIKQIDNIKVIITK